MPGDEDKFALAFARIANHFFVNGGFFRQDDQLIADGLTPIRRWGQPEDVARAARALASGDFDFATAAVVDVDGGFHLRVLE